MLLGANWRKRHILAATALAALIAGPARAQDNEQDIEALIAESSSPRASLATARAQIAAGELTEASATLERALLADPNANDVRLLYASTLCRLGDMQAARIEIRKLDRQEISTDLWTEADQACGASIRQPLPPERETSSGLHGNVYAGVAYDGDAAGAIALQTDFFGAAEEDDGFAAISGAQFMYRSGQYDSGGGLYAGFSGVSKHDISGPDQDYDIGRIRAGYGRSGGPTGFSIGGVLGHTRLSGDPYATEYGADGELTLGSGGSTAVQLRAEAVYQDYRRGFPGNAADGLRFDLSAAVEGRLAEKDYYTLGAALELKTADAKSFGYRGGRIFGGVHFALPRRHYLALSATLRYIDFRDDEPFTDRKDWRGYGRAAYGIPINRRGLFIEAGGSYTFRSVRLSSTTGGSVPDLAAYHSPGADLRLVWAF